jgi:hypothetical protein
MKYGTALQISRPHARSNRSVGRLVLLLIGMLALAGWGLSIAAQQGLFADFGLIKDDNYSYYMHREFGDSNFGAMQNPYDEHARGNKRRFGSKSADIRDRYGVDYDDPYGNSYGGTGKGYSAPYKPLRTVTPRNIERPVATYGHMDPADEVAYGMAANTTYSQYWGYSNPYLNMLRLDFGPGYGTGDSMPEDLYAPLQ